MNEPKKETKQHEKKENLNDLMIKTKPNISSHQKLFPFLFLPKRLSSDTSLPLHRGTPQTLLLTHQTILFFRPKNKTMIEAPSGLTLSDVFTFLCLHLLVCFLGILASKRASILDLYLSHSPGISLLLSAFPFGIFHLLLIPSAGRAAEAGGWVLGMDVQWAGMGWDGGHNGRQNLESRSHHI